VLLNYALALLSGVLLFLIHPRFNLTLLAPFAIAPLVYALAREWRPLHRFLLGYTAGVTFWAGINYWIQFVISVHGGLGDAGGTVVFVLFCLIKGLYIGVFGLLGGILIQKRFAVLAVPLLWVAIERIPGPFFYTWLVLGNAGADMAVPMRLAPFTGVYGLSFVFALLGTAVACAALRRPRRELAWVALPALTLLLPSLPAPEKGSQSAVSVQPNIPERENWTVQEALSTQHRMEYLSLQSALDRSLPDARLILWPEVPAPIYYFEDTLFRDRLNNMARLAQAHVLIGTVAHTPEGAPLNAALMVSPAGEPLGRYDKMFPVPFGEYIPWPFKGLVTKITSEVGDFEPGREVIVFPLGDRKVGAFICYESAFPHFVRQFAVQGASVLANLSNDGYFGRSAAREQHLSLVRMRAAENRRWVLRSTNDGITASVDAAGRVLGTVPPFVQTSGRLQYTPISELSFYTRFGDVFAWSCVAFSAVFLFLSQLPTHSRG
jgi:apolipoprotein N-acyltransferase